jgi:hypothetical protein
LNKLNHSERSDLQDLTASETDSGVPKGRPSLPAAWRF